jgi:hypothetical protein
VENGKVTVVNKWDKVAAAEIPPYKWNADLLLKLRLADLAQVERLTKKQDKVRDAGRTVDQCFDILSWTWDFTRKMPPVLDESGKPTKKQAFKKCRARAHAFRATSNCRYTLTTHCEYLHQWCILQAYIS